MFRYILSFLLGLVALISALFSSLENLSGEKLFWEYRGKLKQWVTKIESPRTLQKQFCHRGDFEEAIFIKGITFHSSRYRGLDGLVQCIRI